MKYLRLKKSGDFQKLFKKGKRVFSPALTIIYTQNAEGKPVMGIAVSKKHGKAVKRNRIKRLVRAAFSAEADMLKGGYSMVILPKVAQDYDYKSIENSLVSCFKRIQR